MKRLLILGAAMLAIAGCKGAETPGLANEAAANITALDEANLSGEANITDVPADDGDAPMDTETNAK